MASWIISSNLVGFEHRTHNKLPQRVTPLNDSYINQPYISIRT